MLRAGGWVLLRVGQNVLACRHVLAVRAAVVARLAALWLCFAGWAISDLRRHLLIGRGARVRGSADRPVLHLIPDWSETSLVWW